LHVPKLYLNFDRWQIREMTAKFAHRAGMSQIYRYFAPQVALEEEKKI